MSSNPHCGEDLRLKERCLERDPAAWDLLFKDHFPGLVGYCRSLIVVGTIAGLTADEIATDIFSSLWMNDQARVRQYDPECAPWQAYLRWLTDCDLQGYRRREKLQRARECPLRNQEPVDWGADEGCVRAKLLEFLAALPPILLAHFAAEYLGRVVPEAPPAGSPAAQRQRRRRLMQVARGHI